MVLKLTSTLYEWRFEILRAIGGMVGLMDLVVTLIFLAFSCGDATFGIDKIKDIDHPDKHFSAWDLERMHYALSTHRVLVVLVAVFNVTLCTLLITIEMETDMFPHHIPHKVLSNLYFKGTCYLVLAYFTICGGNTYSIIPAVITGIFAVIMLVLAKRIQNTNLGENVDDQYLPEISISESRSEEDIDTLITEYEPPTTIAGLSDLKQPITDFKAVNEDRDITPPPQSLIDRVRSGEFVAVQETR